MFRYQSNFLSPREANHQEPVPLGSGGTGVRRTDWGESQEKLAVVMPNIIPTVGSRGRRNRRGRRIRFNDIAILS